MSVLLDQSQMRQSISLWQYAIQRSYGKNFRTFMNILRAVKFLVLLISILGTYFVDHICVADWIVESEWDEFDIVEAENGEKMIVDSGSDEVDGTWDNAQEAEDGERIRILKDFSNITKQVNEDNFSQTGTDVNQDGNVDREPLREKEQLPYGLSRLWSVPFLRIPMSKLLHNLNVSEFNSNVSKIILDLHNDFKRQFGPTLKNLDRNSQTENKSCSESPGNLNDNFFEFQMYGGYDEYLAHLTEFKVFELAAFYMHDLFADHSDTNTLPISELYQKVVDNGEAEDLEDAYNLLAPKAWVTVQTQCSCHLEHDHFGAGLSGVYYVRMPQHSGGIAIHDPRSNWHEDIILYPKEGEFIMFPSWLRHNVLPTNGPPDDPRISIAWNTYGSWEQTNNNQILNSFKIDDFLKQGNARSMNEFLKNSEEEFACSVRKFANRCC